MILGISGARERFNLVRIELLPKLPQKLRQIVEYRPQTESQTFENFTFNTFVKTELLSGFQWKPSRAK